MGLNWKWAVLIFVMFAINGELANLTVYVSFLVKELTHKLKSQNCKQKMLFDVVTARYIIQLKDKPKTTLQKCKVPSLS